MLCVPEKKVIKTMHVGMTTVFDYDVYEDGSTSKPRVGRSYNFVPGAAKKKTQKQKIKVEMEEEGYL